MKIIADCKPINLSSGMQKLKEVSRSVLFTSIYLAGTASGCAAFIYWKTIRELFNNTILEMVYSRFSAAELICGSFTVAIACCAVLFGSGLSLIGYPLSFASPFMIGAFSGAFFLATISSTISLSIIKSMLLAPLFCIGVCCILSMSEYAADLTGMLTGKRSREAEEWKKYTARFIILTAATIIAILLQSFLLLLFRHLN